MSIPPQNVLEEIKANYMVGVLAVDEAPYPNLGDDNMSPITYSDKFNGVIFYIRAVSPEPVEVKRLFEDTHQTDLYIGIDNKSIKNLPIDYRVKRTSEEKINYIRELLEGKLILFKPVLNIDNQERFHKNINEIVVEDVIYRDNKFYSALPIIDMKREEFEERLLSGQPIDLLQYNHAMPAPLFLKCENYIYGNLKGKAVEKSP